jgi:hypothetical protein
VSTSLDALATTPAEQAALAALRDATGTTAGPMERHCLRCRLIAARIGEQRGWALDAELLTVAAILHDIGLYPNAATGGVYTADGALLARRLLAEAGWAPERIDRCAAAIDRHHDVRAQRGLGDEVEALRLADLVDVSYGLIAHGAGRAWLRGLWREVPRDGLAAELAREVGRALRERPSTLPRIFWRG